MVVLLSPTQVGQRSGGDTRRGDRAVFLVLFATFMTLVIATLTYSVLAGETVARGRAATEELVDGLPFGLAVILLLHGLTLLMQSGNVDRVAIWSGRTLAAVVSPVLTLYYLAEGATDTESARKPASSGACPSAGLPTLGVVLTVVLCIVLILALVPTHFQRSGEERHGRINTNTLCHSACWQQACSRQSRPATSAPSHRTTCSRPGASRCFCLVPSACSPCSECCCRLDITHTTEKQTRRRLSLRLTLPMRATSDLPAVQQPRCHDRPGMREMSAVLVFQGGALPAGDGRVRGGADRHRGRAAHARLGH